MDVRGGREWKILKALLVGVTHDLDREVGKVKMGVEVRWVV